MRVRGRQCARAGVSVSGWEVSRRPLGSVRLEDAGDPVGAVQSANAAECAPVPARVDRGDLGEAGKVAETVFYLQRLVYCLRAGSGCGEGGATPAPPSCERELRSL